MNWKTILFFTTCIPYICTNNIQKYLIVEKGQNITLTCMENISTVSDLKWYNNSTIIQHWQMINNTTVDNNTNSYNFKVRNNFTSLTINNISQFNKYSCNFTSLYNINNDSAYDNNQSFVITVVNKMPTINVSYNKNTNGINLTCSVTSDPISTISWNISNFTLLSNYTYNNTIVDNILVQNYTSPITCIGTFINNMTVNYTYIDNSTINNNNTTKFINLGLHYSIMMFAIIIVSVIIIIIYIVKRV
ncbi:hemagglutinin [Hypsugopox virus]|nr:hemagglutinin [Hypsugopox virus]